MGSIPGHLHPPSSPAPRRSSPGGTYTVRVVLERNPVAPIAFADESTNAAWIHICKYGTYKGHPSGPFQLTRVDFESMLYNLHEQANDIPIDYEHASMETPTGQPVPAAGWITELEIRGDGTGEYDGLWGYAQFTARAASMLRADEYRHNSPVIDFLSVDRQTNKPAGVALFSVALTNLPFFDGQAPIKLTRETKAMGLIQNQDGQEVAAQAGEADALVAALAEMTGLDPMAVIAALTDRLDDVAAMLSEQASEEGVPSEEQAPPASAEPQAAAAASADPAASAVAGAASADAAGFSLDLAQEQIAHLQGQLAELLAEKQKAFSARVEQHVDTLVKEGRVDAKARPDWIKAFAANWEQASRMVGIRVAPVGVKQFSRVDQSESNGEPVLTETEKVVVNSLCAGTFRGRRADAIKAVVARRRNGS